MSFSSIQEKIDGLEPGSSLQLVSGEYGPCLINQPITLLGNDSTFWSDGNFPSILVNSAAVTLKDLDLRFSSPTNQVVLSFAANCIPILENVKIQGRLVDFSGETGQWLIPQTIDTGVLAASHPDFTIDFGVPRRSHILCRISGVVFDPQILTAGINTIRLTVADAHSDSILLGEVEVVSAHISRIIPFFSQIDPQSTQNITLAEQCLFEIPTNERDRFLESIGTDQGTDFETVFKDEHGPLAGNEISNFTAEPAEVANAPRTYSPPPGHLEVFEIPYLFEGKQYFEPRKLGESFFERWDNGQKHAYKNSISDWLQRSGANRNLTKQIGRVETDDSFLPDDKHSLIVTLLTDDGILKWKSQVVDVGFFKKNSQLGLELLGSSLIDHLNRLEIAPWTFDLKQAWLKLVAEASEQIDPKKFAYDLLFGNSSNLNLPASLTIATAIPKLHTPWSWDKKANRVALLAAKFSDAGFIIPSPVHLRALFDKICNQLATGGIPSFEKGEWYHVTLLTCWQYQAGTLLENDHFCQVLVDHLHKSGDDRLLKALVYGYFRDFGLSRSVYINRLAAIICDYLDRQNSLEVQKWKQLNLSYHLFAGVLTPGLCVQKADFDVDLEHSLKSIGLNGSSLWSGLSAELLLARIQIKNSVPVGLWPTIRLWYEKCAVYFRQREHVWVSSIIDCWEGKSVPGDLRVQISRYLVDLYGEPEDHAEMWKECSAEVRQSINQWLLFENLEMFFKLIADYAENTEGEMRSQWGYRKAFWLAVHRTGAVSDIRIAAGKGMMAEYGEAGLKDRFGSKLVKLNGGDQRTCALVLRLGPLTIVDFTHNGKCRIWHTGRRQEKWFKAKQLSRGEFIGDTDLQVNERYNESGIRHFGSETYGWQGVLAEFLVKFLPIPLAKRDYEFFES